jgi:deoxyribodipyrimidine photo-lyase
MKGLFIFRRDLRIIDNTALIKACKECDKIYTIFVFTPEQVSELNKFKSDIAICFMIGALKQLKSDIAKKGGNLEILYGKNNDVVKKCITEWNIDKVYWNKDYTPYAKKRDTGLIKMCSANNIEVVEAEDYYLHAPGSILTGGGTAYLKYTPYMNKAMNLGFPTPNKYSIKCLSKTAKKIDGSHITLKDALSKFVDTEQIMVETFEREKALNILRSASKFSNYSETRNDLEGQTTRLSAPIKFGIVSIREVARAFKSNKGLLRQLVWRDFYAQILNAEPQVLGSALKEQYNNINWLGTNTHYKKWSKGMTGFPIVDAGMRELNETGYMHNRARLIVASFLIKTPLVDWQKGEKYFATKLVDYDPASNNGNWQWVASTGADSQPYFRIFNPWSQSAEHDPDAIYIKKWIPQLESVSPKCIHTWNECYNNPEYDDIDYPSPIVDYKVQREKALKMYKGIMK